MEHYQRVCKIYNSPAFIGLKDKTQILVPEFRGAREVKNRQSHSFEVSLCSRAIAKSISIPGKDIDYNNSLEVVSLLHDLGHPPFGHDGQKLLNKILKKKGYKEGFDDNSQTLEVIKKHKLDLTDYEKASLIKYPHKLYEKQKKEYHRLLKNSIEEDYIYFKDSITFTEKRKRTLSCDIMDLADEIAYKTSDNEDFYILRYGDESFFIEELNSGEYQETDIISFFLYVIEAIKKDNKTMIKDAFNNLRFMMCDNYCLGDNLELVPKRYELVKLLDKLYQFEIKHFIKSKKTIKNRDIYLKIFEEYIEYVFEGNYPSRTYAKLIEKSKSKKDKLRYIRDMIAETTDLYVIDWYEKQKTRN